jgi:protein-S-isoprenylcysteine O-methyltransferase Ste14
MLLPTGRGKLEMHLLGQRLLGTIILVLLGLLVIQKRAATGNIIRDTPSGGVLLWVVHLFNLFFLLVVNPVAGILLVAGRLEQVDVTRLSLPSPVAIAFEGAGISLSLLGYFLMAWALATLRGNYQVGGSVPRPADRLVAQGPYEIVRHPMYTAALCISLGLALLTQSLALLAVTVIYLVLIVPLMPFEEDGLRRAYGDAYERYARGRRRLVPFVY